MNHLAHLLLTEHTPDGFVGALLGDRIKGHLDRHALAPAVRRGVALHRSIDSFTDAHPVHLRSRRRFAPPRRRLAGIIVDVAYDHFLARSWTRHGEGTLDAFAGQVYAALRDRADTLPAGLRAMTARMIERDWLRGYGARDAIARSLAGIARRAPSARALGDSGPAIDACYEALAEDFEAFFPALAEHASRLRATSTRPT